jgi:septal ring factor EnvC (AmiA/AmiB activator)
MAPGETSGSAERERDAALLLLEQCRRGGVLLNRTIAALQRERDEARFALEEARAELARHRDSVQAEKDHLADLLGCAPKFGAIGQAVESLIRTRAR